MENCDHITCRRDYSDNISKIGFGYFELVHLWRIISVAPAINPVCAYEGEKELTFNIEDVLVGLRFLVFIGCVFVCMVVQLINRKLSSWLPMELRSSCIVLRTVVLICTPLFGD